MRSIAFISILWVGCTSGPSNGYAVDLTISASSSLSSEVSASISSLVVNVTGDETATNAYTLGHVFHEERLIYTPLADSSNLVVTVLARDANDLVIAYGDTNVKLKHGATVTAHVVLGSDIPAFDMNVADMGSPDLSGADLNGIDLSNDDQAGNADLAQPKQVLSVTKLGPASANGLVQTSAKDVDCGLVCSAAFAQDSLVTLTASVVPKAGTWFQGWGGDCAANNQPTCTVTMSAARSVTATFVNVNYVFVTSAATSLPLGADGASALQKADMVCNQLASGKLPGTFKAWLSVKGTTAAGGANPPVNAKSRISGGRGWIRPDGLPFADTVDSLLYHFTGSGIPVGKVMYPAIETESGAVIPGDSNIATSTADDGTFYTDNINPNGINCTDWTAASGKYVAGASGGGLQRWTFNSSSADCGTAILLYCFGIDYSTQLAPPPTTGRIGFVTNGTFTPSAGIAAADTLCMTEAQAAHLAGSSVADSYRAMLAGTGTSASSRFDISPGSLPWVRVDGLPLAATAAQLFSASQPLLTNFELRPDGQGWGVLTWTGALAVDQAGSNATTCTNWGSSSGTGRRGFAVDSNVFFSQGDSSCGQASPVYCLQR